MHRSFLVVVASLLVGLLAGLSISAQSPGGVDPPVDGAPVPAGDQVPASAAELVNRLDTVSGRLLEVNDYLRRPAPDLAGITVALPDKTREAQGVLGGVGAAEAAQADTMELVAAGQKLRSLDRIFSRWRSRLQEEITLLEPWRQQLRADAGFLDNAARTPVRTGEELPPVLSQRLQNLASDLDATREPLRRRLDVVVAADVRVGELQTSLRDLAGQLDATRLDRQQQPLARVAPPLWQLPSSGLRPVAELIPENLAVLGAGIDDYVRGRPTELTAFVGILVLLLVIVNRLRRSLSDTEGDELLTRYPYTVTILVWTLIGPFLLLPDLPIGLGLIRGLVDTVLLWRIVPGLVVPEEQKPLKYLLLLAAVLLAQLGLLRDDWYGRVVNVLLGLVALAVFRVLRRTSAEGPGGRRLFRRALHEIARVAPYVIAVGLIAEVAGARALGEQAIGGIVFVSLAVCSMLAAEAILRSMLDAWIAGPGARWSQAVRNSPAAVRRGGQFLARILLLITFINLLPAILPILEPVWLAVGRLLTTPVELGSVEMSLGDVLLFPLGIAVAIAIARFVRFVLDEDVLPRLPMPMGAASAASRLIYYGLVVVGILFALAASGVELSKLTLVVSALGVGIGFGLQNIVNNFVSGLILAFERPVREGDQITLGQTSGRVQQIGLRATRIRTGDGAEVIVPNASLIAGEVTNWTLSDRAQRIEIPISVVADSDPARVQSVLLQAVTGLAGVATRPAPVTVFRGMGPGTLEFSIYVWTDNVDDRPQVESEARARILEAVRKADIGMPTSRVDMRLMQAPAIPAPEAPPAAPA